MKKIVNLIFYQMFFIRNTFTPGIVFKSPIELIKRHIIQFIGKKIHIISVTLDTFFIHCLKY